MAIAKCKLCGSYNGPEEWPDDLREEYNPEVCYKCTIKEKDSVEEEWEPEVNEEDIPVEPSEVPGEPVPTVEDVGEDNLEDEEGDDDGFDEEFELDDTLE